jgi:hypothetical protein
MWLRKTYLDIARDPESSVESMKQGTWQGRPAIEVVFDFPINYGPAGDNGRGRSAYYYDPAARWVCVGERPRCGRETATRGASRRVRR